MISADVCWRRSWLYRDGHYPTVSQPLMGVKIRVGRRDGAARIVLEELRDVGDERLIQALEECLRLLYPESEGMAE